MLNLEQQNETSNEQQASLLAAGEDVRLLRNRMNRRRFLQAAGVTAGAATVVGLSGCGDLFGVDPSTGPAPSPQDVLNFALNLEYLEASFYLYIATGSGLKSADMGSNPGKVTGQSPSVKFTDPAVAALAQQLAADEQAHVQFLRAGLEIPNVTPVDMPSLNLSALGSVTDDASFLAIARALETTGTSAYEGGIQYLVSSVPAVNYAALIHDTEAQHEGALRQFCIAKGVASPMVDKYDQPPVLGPTTMFNTSSITGLNTARNASEVLQIVYAAAGKTGVSSGGFYPNGLNGNIKTT